MFNFMSKTITPLYFKGYRYLWIGMVAVGVATMMQMTARGYLAYELTNSASKLTYVNVAFAFPMLSLSLFGGALSDRLDKQKIIQAGQFAASFLAFVIAALIDLFEILSPVVTKKCLLKSFCSPFGIPNFERFFPNILFKNNLASE